MHLQRLKSKAPALRETIREKARESTERGGAGRAGQTRERASEWQEPRNVQPASHDSQDQLAGCCYRAFANCRKSSVSARSPTAHVAGLREKTRGERKTSTTSRWSDLRGTRPGERAGQEDDSGQSRRTVDVTQPSNRSCSMTGLAGMRRGPLSRSAGNHWRGIHNQSCKIHERTSPRSPGARDVQRQFAKSAPDLRDVAQ